MSEVRLPSCPAVTSRPLNVQRMQFCLVKAKLVLNVYGSERHVVDTDVRYVVPIADDIHFSGDGVKRRAPVTL